MEHDKDHPALTADEQAAPAKSDDDFVTVCAACLTASCWQGLFYCDEYRTANITQKTVRELRAAGREHPSYWVSS